MERRFTKAEDTPAGRAQYIILYFTAVLIYALNIKKMKKI